MTTAARITKPRSSERLLTAADLELLPEEFPSGPAIYELENGRLIIMAPPGDIHGAVESNLTTELKVQGERKGLGKVRCGEVALVLWRNPDRVVGADAVFIATQSLPIRLSKEGYLETIPDLASEVLSKSDSKRAMRQKVKDYLKAGVKVVWVADPKTRRVTAYRPGKKPRVFREKDTLTVEDIIPGFQMPVREVFQL